MTGKVFVEQLKQNWLQIFTWGVGLGFLTLFMSVIVEDREVIEQYSAIIEALPPAILSAFGLTDVAILTTPEGFLVFAGFTYGSIILSVFAVLAGLSITTNDEDTGMMNIVLAQPTPRWQVIVERFLAMVLVLIGIVLLLYTGIFIGNMVFTLEMNMGALFLGAINLIPMVLSIMAITTLIGAVFSNKLIITAVAGSFVLVSYVINTIADAVNKNDIPAAEWVEKISVYNYLGSEGVVIDGQLNTGNVSILLVTAILAVVISVYAFENRDIRG